MSERDEVEVTEPHTWRQVTGATGYKSVECEACGLFVPGSHKPPTNARPCPGPLTISVRLDGDFDLRVGDIWPDGDWPDDITSAAVAALMKQIGRYELTTDWNLQPDILVAVEMDREVRVDV